MNHPAEWARAKDIVDGKTDKDGFLFGDMNYYSQIESLTKALVKQRDETLEEAAKFSETFKESPDPLRDRRKSKPRKSRR